MKKLYGFTCYANQHNLRELMIAADIDNRDVEVLDGGNNSFVVMPTRRAEFASWLYACDAINALEAVKKFLDFNYGDVRVCVLADDGDGYLPTDELRPASDFYEIEETTTTRNLYTDED